MRVIFVVLISAIFAHPPNMSFLWDFFRKLPYASLQHWNIPLKVTEMPSEFPAVRPIGVRKVILSNFKITQKIFRNEDMNHRKI